MGPIDRGVVCPPTPQKIPGIILQVKKNENKLLSSTSKENDKKVGLMQQQLRLTMIVLSYLDFMSRPVVAASL